MLDEAVSSDLTEGDTHPEKRTAEVEGLGRFQQTPPSDPTHFQLKNEYKKMRKILKETGPMQYTSSTLNIVE